MIIYELNNNLIPENLTILLKKYTTMDVILVSSCSLSYMQGIRDAAGLNCILIGSSGAEIQIGNEVPFYTKYTNVYDAIKWLKEINS